MISKGAFQPKLFYSGLLNIFFDISFLPVNYILVRNKLYSKQVTAPRLHTENLPHAKSCCLSMSGNWWGNYSLSQARINQD